MVNPKRECAPSNDQLATSNAVNENNANAANNDKTTFFIF
jgi:hypothetical protein